VSFVFDLGINVASLALFLFGVVAPLYLVLGAIGLTGFREISRYERHNSFYYRLNPLTKILLAVVVTFVAAVTVWWIDLSILVVILASYATLRNPKRKLLIGIAFAFSTMIALAWWWAVNTPYTLLELAFYHQCVTSLPTSEISKLFTPLWYWPSYYQILGYQPVLTLQGILYGLQISTRTVAVFIAALLVIMTSTPSGILRSFGKIRVPVLLIFSLVVAMRTVPRIFDALDTAVKVQFMRGYGGGARRPFGVFYLAGAALRGVIPAMAFLFRGARNTAISADTRAFRAFKTRTYIREATFSRADFGVWAVLVGLIVLAVVSNYMGFGRGIPYSAVGASCGGTGFG
jgi:energy-coupling factor transport system permease protein